MRTRIALVGLCLATLCHAQTAPLQQSSASWIVSDFCRYDANGKRLNSAGAKEIAKTLLLAERPWEEPLEVVIIKDYSVRVITEQKNASLFVADYRALGRLDSSLLLTRMQIPYSDHASVQSEHFSLVLTDTHTEIGLDGRQELTKGEAPEWRIQSYPSQPHVSINAAIAYVRVMGYRAKDVRTKVNAKKTLAQLLQMLGPPATPPQLAGPEAIVSQFIEMQMGGLAQPEIAGQTSTFLVHPESKRNDKIGVARAYAVKKTTFAANKATVSAEYGALGELDSQLRFTSLGERGTVVQQDYKLLLDNKYLVPAYGDRPAREFFGPSRWRIEETPPEEWVSLATAIKYVTQIRNASRDSSIKENADETLVILRGLR